LQNDTYIYNLIDIFISIISIIIIECLLKTVADRKASNNIFFS